jgi:hypothetical protein
VTKRVLGVDVQPTVVKEPVLDILPIDMTDTAARTKSPSAPARKKNAKRSTARAKVSRATLAAVQPTRTRDGSVGKATFKQVEALLKQGKNKTEAFKQIAADTGKNSGTVAANYYRVARTSGAAKASKRRGKASGTPITRRRQSRPRSARATRVAKNGDGIDQIVNQLVSSVQALAEAVKSQDAEMVELRGRLDGVRRAMS